MIKLLMLTFLFNSSLNDRNFSGDSKNKRTPINELNINIDSLKSRIEHINSTTPFQIDYTPQLEKSIIKYLEKKQAAYLDLYKTLPILAHEDKFLFNGMDKLEFKFSANKGSRCSPISLMDLTLMYLIEIRRMLIL